VTCRTLEDFYHIDAHTFEKQYKEVLSGYRTWSELSHADEWLVFPENIGPNLAIDETNLSNGELYTIVTNRDRHGGEGCLVAVVSGTKSEDVIRALEAIPEQKRDTVQEVTLDLSDSMRRIVRSCFTKALRVIDRFHIQKLACDAVQEMRIKHRWDAIQEANDDMENAKLEGREYIPLRTATPGRNCWQGADTCSSSRQTNGRTGRRRGPGFSLNYIRICRRHIHSVIH